MNKVDPRADGTVFYLVHSILSMVLRFEGSWYACIVVELEKTLHVLVVGLSIFI